MLSIYNHSLKYNNTFGIDISAKTKIVAKTSKDVLAAWHLSKHKKIPFLILGEGSNVLFMDNFNGIIILNRIKGIHIVERPKYWKIIIGSGENWHSIVKKTLEKGIFGLENLGFIPGTTGSAPIQNIGAYGVEFKDVCDYVDILNLRNNKIQRMYNDECNFSYRDSIFKQKYYFGYIIISVGLKLNKTWKPILSYHDLIHLNPIPTNAWQVFNAIRKIRQSKIIDPVIFGNVGSFFKNPVVNYNNKTIELFANFSDIPYHLDVLGKIKLSAAWLIEQCNLKGFRVGGAAVYTKQPLVLINIDNATPIDIAKLAKIIYFKVKEKFNILLEPEVRFIGANGECNFTKLIQ